MKNYVAAEEDASSATAAADARRAQQLEVDGIVEDWHRFEMRCVLSHQRLVDPSKGPLCSACCNYQALRDYVGRCASGPKECPLAGCGARLHGRATLSATIQCDCLSECRTCRQCGCVAMR